MGHKLVHEDPVTCKADEQWSPEYVCVCLPDSGHGPEGPPDINKLSGQNASHLQWICFLLQ